ncbi:MAG: TonB family protein [Acidobacteriota bacterium]
MTDSLPRPFGSHLLTAELGEDALGRTYRAIRTTGEREFVRLRIFEGPDISEDAVLDAIEENGEVHNFLKNPAIARGVTLDSVDGTPFLAWNEESGRTLDALIARARLQQQTVPYEHALLITEKVATALDHAYNTTIDGDRTLHGLVWPGFVSISDDGETRLTGFGLAAGFLPSLGRPRFAREISPYLAPEEREENRIGKNSDVYSLGAILFELLIGRLPDAAEPMRDLRIAQRDGAPIAPDVAAVLRLCLAPPAGRYQSSGEVRRELGKLLFSGPYAPSTFNLAFFLNGLFSAEIEAETNARLREAGLEMSGGAAPRPGAAPPPAPRFPAPPPRPPAPRALVPPPGPSHRPAPPGAPPAVPEPPERSRNPFVFGGILLILAAAAGTAWVYLRRTPPAPAPLLATPLPVVPTETPSPAVVIGPTTKMSDAEFKDEVARRVAVEMKKMELAMRRASPSPTPVEIPRGRGNGAGLAGRAETPATPLLAPAAVTATSLAEPAPKGVEEPPREEPPPPPTAAPAPPESVPASNEIDVAPKIATVVKPSYPPVALRAHIGGVVLLRVLVSEAGVPVEIQVIKGAPGGLTESAVAAVKGWRFVPASRAGAPVPAWTMVPIPFEP